MAHLRLFTSAELRGAKRFDQGQRANKWQREYWNSDRSASEGAALHCPFLPHCKGQDPLPVLLDSELAMHWLIWEGNVT